MSKGVEYVSERIDRSRRRLSVLNSNNHTRDLDEVWEAYYDLEEAILMARVVFNDFNRPGKPRDLLISFFTDDKIRAAFARADSSLILAKYYLNKRSGNETIKSLRKARDQLKGILRGLRRSAASSRGSRN